MTYLSCMCPGATPDVLAHIAGPMHGAILTGKLGKKCQFVGDAAFPNNYEQPAFLTPFSRCDLRDPETRQARDNYNFYLSQLRINVECCFGMLVNKFRILTRPLETTSLSRALLTFRVCCCLHNFVINDRLNNDVNRMEATGPRGHRLVQVPSAQVERAHFEEIPRVFPGEDLDVAMQSVDRMTLSEVNEREICDSTELAPSREEMVARIARSGYIRPRRYGAALHPYLCF